MRLRSPPPSRWRHPHHHVRPSCLTFILALLIASPLRAYTFSSADDCDNATAGNTTDAVATSLAEGQCINDPVADMSYKVYFYVAPIVPSAIIPSAVDTPSAEPDLTPSAPTEVTPSAAEVAPSLEQPEPEPITTEDTGFQLCPTYFLLLSPLPSPLTGMLGPIIGGAVLIAAIVTGIWFIVKWRRDHTTQF